MSFDPCGKMVTKPEVCPTCDHGAQWMEDDCDDAFHWCRACTWQNGERITTCPDCAVLETPGTPEEPEPEPIIPMLLWCPLCHERHLDEGEFATKPHTTHACQKCGLVWKPAKVPTCGVQFLSGYKNEV